MKRRKGKKRNFGNNENKNRTEKSKRTICKKSEDEFNHEIELLHKCNNLLLPLYFSHSIVGGRFFLYFLSLLLSFRTLPSSSPLSHSHSVRGCNVHRTVSFIRYATHFVHFFLLHCIWSDLIYMNPAARTPISVSNIKSIVYSLPLFCIHIHVATVYRHTSFFFFLCTHFERETHKFATINKSKSFFYGN